MTRKGPSRIGRYAIVRSLGEGGMGAVYLARDPAIDRPVAIKLLREGFAGGQARERFLREAQAIGRLHHPNIVTVFDFGEHDGEPFIAMEYVEGRTLAQLAARHEVTRSRALKLVDELCAGLHYAHRAGIVHRDIKPANIMVDADGTVRILDFGLARGIAVGASFSGTESGVVVGTLNYMSPEQLAAGNIDHRSDIFAVGAVFYELLSGRQAFPGEFVVETFDSLRGDHGHLEVYFPARKVFHFGNRGRAGRGDDNSRDAGSGWIGEVDLFFARVGDHRAGRHDVPPPLQQCRDEVIVRDWQDHYVHTDIFALEFLVQVFLEHAGHVVNETTRGALIDEVLRL